MGKEREIERRKDLVETNGFNCAPDARTFQWGVFTLAAPNEKRDLKITEEQIDKIWKTLFWPFNLGVGPF